MFFFLFQDWADGDCSLLDVEKEKNEIYSNNGDKDYGYGATGEVNEQVPACFHVLDNPSPSKPMFQYKQDYDEAEEQVYEDEGDYYVEEDGENPRE